MKRIAFLVSVLYLALAIQAGNVSVEWDAHSLIIDGKRVCPVMGEIHYSRVPADEWEAEVKKMKEGGVTIIATYVFWNHVEEQEGVFRWDGQRCLRRFIEICRQEQLPVVLRLGPFCHGEARNGGIPDWVFDKGCKTRDQNPVFMGLVEKLYRQIFTQIQGLQWKDGGPVMAAQFDNEYRGKGEYLMALKKIATEIGFDLPFYTRTGWPELATPVPFGEMLPLYGDYADGFWERSIEETAGNYYKAFNFRPQSNSSEEGNMGAMDGTGDPTRPSSPLGKSGGVYPYFTCELGGGMMTAYHRRPYIYPEDAYAMAIVKLGSGSNLLGYYMYHGGTNPEGMTDLNETQRTVATNYNDLPVKTYDFQAPLNEFGQRNPQFYMLRKLHLFMQDWGEVLAPMEASFPCAQNIAKGDDSFLRWSVRKTCSDQTGDCSDHPALTGTPPDSGGERGFIFINNYERLQNLSTKKNVQLEAGGVRLPKLTIPAGTVCIFPVNIDGIRYATAQLTAKRDGKIYLEQIKGIPTTLAIGNKVLKNLKAKGPDVPVYQNIYLLTSEQAERLFLDEEGSMRNVDSAMPLATEGTQECGMWNEECGMRNVQCTKVKEAGALRTITIGVNKVAEEPTDEDFEQAAVYTITLPQDISLHTPHSTLLEINYRGDVARLYADGKLIDDNFYNGRPFQYALWRLPKDCRQLELRILPLQQNMPVYFPREADITPGEQVKEIKIEKMKD